VRHNRVTFVAILAAVVFVTGLARAQSRSALECYKFKSKAPKGSYTADQMGIGEHGCIIKVPAKVVCSATTLTNMQPTPPGGGPTGTVSPLVLFCYQEKCPATPITTGAGLHDMFETYPTATQTQKARMLCVGASPSGAFLDPTENAML
jgi:hypothetical protein